MKSESTEAIEQKIISAFQELKNATGNDQALDLLSNLMGHFMASRSSDLSELGNIVQRAVINMQVGMYEGIAVNLSKTLKPFDA